jgi:hypothetical protein
MPTTAARVTSANINWLQVALKTFRPRDGLIRKIAIVARAQINMAVPGAVR